MTRKLDGHWRFAHVASVEDDSEQATVTIKAIESISPSALIEYRNDKTAISEYFASVDLVNCVRLNLQDFLEAVVDYGGMFLETRHISEIQMDVISLNLSRLLLNILSMFRSLVDHTGTSLAREFGKDSQQLMNWKNKLNSLFDGSMEYRFFYKLRNYAQHVGFPPIHISFTETAGSEGISLRLDFSRDSLLEEKSLWGAIVRKDLENGQSELPVLDLLDQWSRSFNELSSFLLGMKREAAISSAKRIANHRSSLGLPETGQICVVCFPETEKKPSLLNLRLDWLPEKKAVQILNNTAQEQYGEKA